MPARSHCRRCSQTSWTDQSWKFSINTTEYGSTSACAIVLVLSWQHVLCYRDGIRQRFIRRRPCRRWNHDAFGGGVVMPPHLGTILGVFQDHEPVANRTLAVL